VSITTSLLSVTYTVTSTAQACPLQYNSIVSTVQSLSGVKEYNVVVAHQLKAISVSLNNCS